MKIRQAEGITGYEIRRIMAAKHATVLVALTPNTGPMLYGVGKNEKEACRDLVKCVYRWHCELVDERAGYRCEECSGMKWLAHHHERFRSHGGSSEVSNLRLLCIGCHNARHKRKSA